MRFSRFALFSSSLALLSFAVPLGPAGAAELRCDELGNNCVCSEPMGANDFPSRSSVTSWNPSDSSGSLECPNSGLFLAGSMSLQSRQIDFQGNRFGATQVFSINSNDWNTRSPRDLCSGRKRICTRYYRRWSSDFPNVPSSSTCGGGGSYTMKNWEGCSHDYQGSTPPGGNCQGNQSDGYFNWRSYWSKGDGLMDKVSSAGPDEIRECKGAAGCRFELCWGVTDSSADLCTANADVTMDVYVADPATGNESHWRAVGQGSDPNPLQSGGGGLGGFQLNIDTNCPGSQYVHHAMVASWGPNSGQRIGGAIEVEGDSGVPDPGPGGPPPAPVLLE